VFESPATEYRVVVHTFQNAGTVDLPCPRKWHAVPVTQSIKLVFQKNSRPQPHEQPVNPAAKHKKRRCYIV
jgi:hypothetical protein